MMIRYYALVLLIAVGGYGLGTLLLPNGGELALVYYKSGRYDTARRYLEKELKSGNLSASNIHFSTETYLKLGDVRSAASLVQRYIEDNPNDLAARKILIRLYTEADQPGLLVENLEGMEKLKPSLKRRKALLEIYWSRGNYKKWEATLRRLTKDGDANRKELFQLAQIEARNGKKAQAVALLKRTQKRKAFKLDDLTLYVTLEIDLGNEKMALEAVEAWLAKRKKVRWALYFASLFRQRGQNETALLLLQPYAAQAGKDRSLRVALTELDLETGKAERAVARLLRAEKGGYISPSEYNLFVIAAMKAGNWPLAKQILTKTNPSELETNTLLSLTNEAVSRGDLLFVKTIDSRLNDKVRNIAPVVAARLKLALSDRAQALRWARHAEQIGALSEEQSFSLLAVYSKLGDNQKTIAFLRKIAFAGNVRSDAILRFAVMFSKLKLQNDGLRLIAEAERKKTTIWTKAARLLLTAKKTVAPPDLGWMSAIKSKPIARRLLRELTDAALDLKHYTLATATAGRLVALSATTPNRLRWARALALSGKANQALSILRPLMKSNPAVTQSVYAAAVVGAIKTGDMPRADAIAFLTQYLGNRKIPFSNRKSTVYDLIASKAQGVVLPVLKTLSEEQGASFKFLYLEALLQSRRNKLFAKNIAAAIRVATTPQLLRRLGQLAFQESLWRSAGTAYTKLLRIRKGDAEALKQLGMIAAFAGNNATARRFLTAYLATGRNDYKAAFTLGEIITKFSDWQRATPYFQSALRAVNALPHPSLEDLKMQAQLYYRTGRFQAANDAYEKLLKRFPNDRKLRNKYGDFLIAIGRYDRAKQLRLRSR